MKKILLFLAVMLPLFVFAQTKTVDGFWGIKFGSNKQQVIDAIKAKGGTLDEENSNKDFLAFDGVNFAQRKVFFLAIKLYNNKFFEAIVGFKPDKSEVIDEFEKMVKELQQPYGDANVFRNFKSPYYKGDGYETQAISVGKATFSAYWHTNNAENNSNYVSLTIDKDLTLQLSYQDGTIVKQAIAAQNQKKTADY